MIHYGLYNVGLVIMLPALYLMLHGGNTAIEPVVAVGSLIVAAAVLVFAFVVSQLQACDQPLLYRRPR